MLNAVVAVDKGLPLRQAAEMYRVPKSTLHDHVSGKVSYGARPGPDPYLSVEEEEELASFLLQTAKIGYPHTKRQVLELVQQIIDEKGITATVSSGWWERFCSRHPKVTLRAAVPFSLARAIAADSEVINISTCSKSVSSKITYLTNLAVSSTVTKQGSHLTLHA